MDPVRWADALSRPRSRVRWVLPVLAVGYVLAASGGTPSAVDLGLGVLAGAVGLLGGRAPVAMTLAQAGVLLAAELVAAGPMSPFTLLTSLAVLEVAVRRSMPVTIAVAAVPTLVLVGAAATAPVGTDVLDLAHRATFIIVAPLLLGAWLRSTAQTVRQSRAAARVAEERRAEGVRSARLSERTDIAREVHDLVAHHVASIALRTAVAREVVPQTDPRLTSVLDEVHDAAIAALGDLRELVAVLRDPAAVEETAPDLAPALAPALVEPGNLPALLGAVIDRSVASGIPVTAHLDAAAAGMDAVRGLTVLRIVQEGLTNVAKHAGPGVTTDVTVIVTAGEVQVSVADGGPTGDGGPPGPVFAPSGVGLTGLRERVDLLGGTLIAGPTYAGGWELDVRLPLDLAATNGRPCSTVTTSIATTLIATTPTASTSDAGDAVGGVPTTVAGTAAGGVSKARATGRPA